MKKKLLLIGNKPINENYSDIIKEYDFVVRVNRMTNFEQTSGKCDLWLADVHKNALELFKQENLEKFISSKNAIIFNHSKETANMFLSEINYTGNITYINFDDMPINKYISVYDYDFNKGMRITNVIWMLIYCLEKFSNDYEIHTLGVSNRLFLNNPIHSAHNKIYKAEDYFVNSLADKQIIKCIDGYNKIDHTEQTKGYIKNIPLFSSFWHSENDILPKLVIASINSFIKNGCPYHLYTYKKYKNIPEGCIIKDANEIVDFSEFFIGSRNDIASFSDMFRIYLVNKVDTAWTDTDNFFITDDFPTKTVLMSQDGRIQNSFFYIENNKKGLEFKKKLLEFYENLIIQDYDNDEMIKAKQDILKYNNKTEKLSHAKWGMGGSCLFTNINEIINMNEYLYDYYKYFNSFHFSEQFQLWIYPEEEYMNYFNKDVKILVMSMALLQRDIYILAKYNKNSYIANLYKKYL